MPAPKHITELLTKILSESPDRPLRGAYDCEAEADDKLIAVGLDPVAVKKLMWSDEDSVTFAVDAKYHVVMWVANSADQRAFSHADMDDLFTGIQRETKIDKGVVGMDWKKYKVLASWHRDFFNSGDRTDKNMLLGRLWKNNRFVSFWSKKADTTKEWKLITNFIREMGLDPEKCVYEFIDKLDVELYDEVVGKETASVEPSAEELAALHVKTDGGVAKKKALGDIGKYRAVQHQKDRVGDGVIQRGNLLKENPDTVYFPTTSEFDQKLQNHGIKKPRRVLRWGGEAVTFSYDKSADVLVFCVPDDYAMRHVDVYKTMRTYLYNKDAFTFFTDSDSLWTLTPEYPDSETQPITFIGIRGESEIADYILKIQGEQGPTNGGRQHYITGRVWPKDQVISYWAKRNDALESTAFNAVLKMLASIKVDPTKTLYEFGDDEDAIYFYDELGIEKASTMTKERYAELISRQHIDPEAKKELRKYNLAHGMEEPNKFGNESPAAVKFRQNQSDGTIKRGNLLKEDPDKIHTANGRWEFTDDDAQTFIYRSQDGLLFRARTGTWKSPSKMFHSDMVMLFASIGSVFNHDSIDTDDGDSIKITTVDQFNTYSEIMDLGIVWDDSAGLITNRQKATIQCFGDTSKTIKFFKSLSQDPEELDDPRIRMKYSSIGIMGRYWEDTEVSSFWLNKRDLGRLIAKGALDTYFDYMGISKENARLNAIDKSCGIFDVKSALEAAGKKATMSKADTTDALSRPHLGKGNKNMAGDKSVEDIEAEKKKRSDNYSMWLTTPHIRKKDAAYNALLPALEEHKLMTENPDTVIDSDGHTTVCKWNNPDAVAFFAFPTFCAILPGGVHDQIWGGLTQCYREQSPSPILRPKSSHYRIKVDDVNELHKQLSPDEMLGKLIQQDIDDEVGEIRNELPNVLAGRIWTDRKIISFWSDQETVIKNWKNIESMGKKFFKDIADYQIDWLERDHDGREMTLASKLSAANATSPTDNTEAGMKKLLAKIFADPTNWKKLDTDTLKNLRKVLHLLDPEEKKKAMEILGMRTVHTVQDIADKLGMTVAEFNHIMHVNESVNQPAQNRVMFHVTMSGRAKNIAANGLRCNSKRSIGAPSLDGNCKGRIFLTDAAGVDFWFDRAELFARDNADDFLKEGWIPFVLQINVNGLQMAPDPHGSTDSRHSAVFVTDDISPDRIRAWDGSQWIPCAKIQNIDFSQAIDAEDGYGDFRSPSPLIPTGL